MMIKTLIFGKGKEIDQIAIINFKHNCQKREILNRKMIHKIILRTNQSQKFRIRSKIHNFQREPINQSIHLMTTVKVRYLKKIDLPF